MSDWYQLSKEEVLKQLKSSTSSGLKNATIADLRKEFGDNSLKAVKQKSKFIILLNQFKDIMIIILIVAAVISFLVGEHTDAYVILAIIIGNAIIGYTQENNAEESVRMLQKMSSQHALVLREGHPVKVETTELVPGDLLLLEAGDIVPADARLLEVSSFKTEEAALTGESHTIDKITSAIKKPDLLPGDQHNMIFKGTIISNGTAKAVVTTTGMHTELGKIAGLLDVKDQKTPLQKRLEVFSKQLAVIVVVICLVVFGFGLWRGEPPFAMFLTALSLAVAALPEALPAVITIALAGGARRMVRQKALVRMLPAVETLGSVTYICSDKTGTLTQNVMTVENTWAVKGKEELLRHAMILNNEVRLSEDEELLGDSTETAMVSYAQDKGLSVESSEDKYPLISKVPFDSVRMRMSTLHVHQDQWLLFVKGAPVKIVEVLDQKYKEQIPEWLEMNHKWAAEGLRVLFFAYKVFDRQPEMTKELEKDLEFLGMIAMIDPPREEVIAAIQECKTAGIKSVMITGDQPLTASAIAERLQIIEKGAESKTGADLTHLSQEELIREIEHIAVFARVSPEQKLNIVKALQANGEFVAMTGDGVNDAPSLKQADIGVAMGITGTDVSKEAADMILLDDNFATIVKAVKEGRRIYDNIRKFVLYILSCNLGEILTIFLAPFLGLAIPLLPIHILWINLVTDGLPGLALAAEPAEKDIMQRPPRPPKENLFAGGLTVKIVTTGIVLAIAALFTQYFAVHHGYDTRTQQTMVFTVLCFVQMVNALSVRFVNHSMFSSRIFSNLGMWGAILLTIILQLLVIYVPAFNSIFKTRVLDWNAMKIVLLVTLGSALAIEVIKYLTKVKSTVTHK
ncbi:Cation-transporting ATPase, E1-E2 family [Arcticibacter svalbardensis MN12-7]|uniref:Cation-transporting ATPase, E1-E2 family n=1 Tax=Arcticibacter svalbardensis MN12-7 TaxID=1150600 RepID=R9GTD8_9SPHI|nr:cation-translocating P-type ATPase [Arcticibacter svalbardensis]EOR94810.1 Cation-transporting ATPase, E1-E2 family [Arcticibacter svalbardensis MN12-7]